MQSSELTRFGLAYESFWFRIARASNVASEWRWSSAEYGTSR